MADHMFKITLYIPAVDVTTHVNKSSVNMKSNLDERLMNDYVVIYMCICMYIHLNSVFFILL